VEVIVVVALAGLIVPAWWLADRSIARARAAVAQISFVERTTGGAPDTAPHAPIRRAA